MVSSFSLQGLRIHGLEGLGCECLAGLVWEGLGCRGFVHKIVEIMAASSNNGSWALMYGTI